MSRHTYKLIAIVLLGVALGVGWDMWWGVPLAHAQAPVAPQGTDTTIATIVTRIVTALNLMTWILFTLLNYILDPIFMFDLDGDNGADGGLMKMLNTIWQLSRDIVNVIFAIALIGAAVYTIVTANKEFLNQHAQKFVLAVVLVNFSWFFPRIILDASNVLAATIYNIPSMIETDDEACEYTSSSNKPGFCTQVGDYYECECSIVTDAQFLLKPEEANNLSSPANGYNCILGNLMCYKEEKLADIENIAGYSAILNGLVINHGRLAELAHVPAPIGGNRIDQLLMFIVQEMLIVVIHIALFFPLLAMTAAFLIRIPVLWITIAFMPFYFLTFVGGEQFGGEELKKIMDTFLKMAFLPAIVAIPLAIGFIMINAGSSVDLAALDRIPIRLSDGISNFGQLLWLALSLGVVWVGVFKALSKGGDFVSGITEKIRDTGQSVGRIAAKAPLAMPLPIPGGATALGLMNNFKPRNIEAALNSGKSLKEVLGGLKGKDISEDGNRKGVVNKLKEEKETREKIELLVKESQTNAGSRTELASKLREMGYSQVTEDNLHEKLRAISADLKKETGSGLADEKTFKRIEEAIKAARPKPPGGGI